MDRIYISAAHKSSGKTTLTIGLCAALRQRNLKVQAYKKGPDYIDPMWHGLASGRDCHNLDFHTMSDGEIIATVQRYSVDADITIIEGNKGLYDGVALDGSNSNAAVAKLTKTPVVLVIDCEGTTRGIAPLLLGYQAFDRDIHIAGVILNKFKGDRHEQKLRSVVEHYTDIPVIGAVPSHSALKITERHLGLVPSNESHLAQDKIDIIARLVAEHVELDYLQRLAGQAPPCPETDFLFLPPLQKHRVRIGIARDAAFGFYYPGDLEALKMAGAELVFFDALHDSQLPDVDGLFIGGGFPESWLTELEANRSLREQIRQAIENGMPAYAECGGLMYLTRRISWHDSTAEMVGVIPADTVMHAHPRGRGYIEIEETDYMPWPDKIRPETSIIPAHEFHYSTLTNLEGTFNFAYKMHRGSGIIDKQDGIVYKNLLACYAHLRDTSRYHWAHRFVHFISDKITRKLV